MDVGGKIFSSGINVMLATIVANLVTDSVVLDGIGVVVLGFEIGLVLMDDGVIVAVVGGVVVDVVVEGGIVTCGCGIGPHCGNHFLYFS